MQRIITHFNSQDTQLFKLQLLHWAQKFDTVVWLDSNESKEKHHSFEGVLAFEEESSIKTTTENAFESLKHFQTKTCDYLFGYLGYDLKNSIENLDSQNFDGLQFPGLYFFQPKKLIFISENKISFKYLQHYAKEIETDFYEIQNIQVPTYPEKKSKIDIKARISKKDYLKKVENILHHIHRGDLYEMNFCQEFYAEESLLNPIYVYEKLNRISKTPFATFLKLKHQFLLSASPERYLKKEGKKIISQPIKGTAKRATSESEDFILKTALENDPKEQAENVMIVDLVRNDLSRLAIKGSVQVEELCKVYSFKQVHQMISTITAEVSEEIHPVDIIKNSYPMGSMTGAPKVAAMKFIETFEETKRGLYSGAVGYFTPKGDFDFNVVIRSILYNEQKKYISFSVGSAITSKSIPEKELEECLLKAKAMHEVLC